MLAALALALLSLQHPGQPRQRRHRAEARQRRLDELHVVGVDGAAASARELEGLLARGDTYDARDHGAAHAEFKRAHNRVFAALARRLNGPVFYLDGPDGGSTAALRAAGVATDRLHVANPHASTCAALRAPPHALARVVHARAEDALATDAALRTAPLCAAYLDGCSGRAAPLIAMVGSLLGAPRADALARTPALALGFTLTRADPSGASLGDRELEVTRAVAAAARRAGFGAPIHVADEPAAWGLEPFPKEHDDTATVWLMLENKEPRAR